MIVFTSIFRKYIDKELVPFANANPQIAMYVRNRHNRHPRIVAVYCESYLS